MRKILVATTAFVSLVAASAFAGEAPTVTIGGVYSFEAGYAKQKSAFKTGFVSESGVNGNQKNVLFSNTLNLYVAAKGTADNGVTYGANARVRGSSRQDKSYVDGKTSKTYAWLESSTGRVEMGSNWAVSKILKVGAESIAKGTGGASDGHWVNYVNASGAGTTSTSLVSSPDFKIKGDSILSAQSTIEEQMRVTWISPRYNGFQFGVSFTPDMAKNGADLTGERNATSDPTKVRQKNIVSLGLNYTNAFDDVNVSLSAGYDRSSKVKRDLSNNTEFTGNNLINPLKSYTFGAAVGKGEYSVAASYGHDGKGGQASNVVGAKNHFWTAGAAYENGPFAGSLTYFHSKKGNKGTDATAPVSNFNKVDAYSLGLDYQLAAGFKPFIEATHFKTKYGQEQTVNTTKIKKNSGYVVMLGTSVSF
jgi:outer membrane protein OmpU